MNPKPPKLTEKQLQKMAEQQDGCEISAGLEPVLPRRSASAIRPHKKPVDPAVQKVIDETIARFLGNCKPQPIDRIERIMRMLRTIWEKNPDLRLLQLLHDAIGDGEYYNLDDETLERKLAGCYYVGDC